MTCSLLPLLLPFQAELSCRQHQISNLEHQHLQKTSSVTHHVSDTHPRHRRRQVRSSWRCCRRGHCPRVRRQVQPTRLSLPQRPPLTTTVIHFALAAAIKTELPLLLTNQVPDPKSSSIGTGNWAVPPRAIVFGGAFTLADILALRELASGIENRRRIPWLRADISLGNLPAPKPGVVDKAYSESILQRLKAMLGRLQGEGKLDGDGDEELYPF